MSTQPKGHSCSHCNSESCPRQREARVQMGEKMVKLNFADASLEQMGPCEHCGESLVKQQVVRFVWRWRCEGCGCEWTMFGRVCGWGNHCPANERGPGMTNQEGMMPIAQQELFELVERHMMIALSHLSNAQELLTKADLHEAAFRLDQAKKGIIQELEYRREQRERDQDELGRP